MFGKRNHAEFDAELAEVIKAETRRQEEHIELIASENYASPRSMEAKRCSDEQICGRLSRQALLHGGCEHVDKAEVLAMNEQKTLALTMPACSALGSQANAAVFWHCYRAVTPCWV